MRIPLSERLEASLVMPATGPLAPPAPSWAEWVDRWKPVYLWHNAAIQVAVETYRLDGKRCKVVSEQREDDHGQYWVWRVELA